MSSLRALSERTWMLLILGPLLAANALLGLDIYRLSAKREALKLDYGEVNSIRYGLLSVDAWKANIQGIVSGQIGEFKLSKKQEAVLSAHISKALNTLITEADRTMRGKQDTWSGKMRKLAARTFVSVPEIRKQVPAFTAAIVADLQTPESTRNFKALAQGGLERFAAQSGDLPADKAHHRALLERYGAAGTEVFNRAAEHALRDLERDINGYCLLMLSSAAAFVFAWWLARGKAALHRPLFTLSTAFALVLLIVGLALPMIDLDARIKSVDFLLWDKHIQFRDQVLFFRSKSILQVVSVLLETGKGDSITVGLLLLLFSVLFPLAKLISMERYMRGCPETRRSKFVNFFAFRSGKWSMADVIVVAIFIAYIGFKGVLNTELEGLNIKSAYVEIIATNDTALQPGFILFTAFVLFGFALSAILKRTAPPA